MTSNEPSASLPFADIPEAPDTLVTDGRFNFGRFSTPFRVVNPLDAHFGGTRFYKNFRLKEWQHFALVCNTHYLSLALFNAKSLALAQVCIQNVASKTIYFYERLLPPWALSVPSDLTNTQWGISRPGFHIQFENYLPRGLHRIHFDLAAQKGLLAAAGEFTLEDNFHRFRPMEVCLPLPNGGALYSHKNICPLNGSMKLGGQNIEFPAAQSYALSDIHKGYYPYRMTWHWATAGQVNADGQLNGFNLTNNQVSDQNKYNENCLWLNGSLYSLPPVKFHFDKNNIMQPWHITDAAEHAAPCVDLIFTPEVLRRVDIQALVIANRYRGPYGTFSGTIRPQNTDLCIQLNQFRGMCEDFYLRC